MTSIYDASKEYRTRDGKWKLRQWIPDASDDNKRSERCIGLLINDAGVKHWASYSEQMRWAANDSAYDLLPVEPVVSEYERHCHASCHYQCGKPPAYATLAEANNANGNSEHHFIIRIDRQSGKVINRVLLADQESVRSMEQEK